MEMIRMQQTQTQTQALPRRRALHGLFITILLVGIGVAMTLNATGFLGDSIFDIAGSNAIAITKVSAYVDGNKLVITGDMKNIGTTAFQSVLIDEITVHDLTITQDPGLQTGGGFTNAHGDMDVRGKRNSGTIHEGNGNSTGGAVFDVKVGTDDFAKVDLIRGISTAEDNVISLSPGQSQNFRITIDGVSGSNSLSIPHSVLSGSKLFITVIGTDGQASTVSDPRETQVRQR